MTLPPGYEATTVGGDTRSRIVPEMIPVKKKSQTFSATGVQRDEKFSALAPRLSWIVPNVINNMLEKLKRPLILGPTTIVRMSVELMQFSPIDTSTILIITSTEM